MAYYVYEHIRPDKNIPFYVGVGTRDDTAKSFKIKYSRAFEIGRVSIVWMRIYNKTGRNVQIVYESNIIEEVHNKERELIKKYGKINDGGTLVNITGGGYGTLGFSRTEECNKLIGQKQTGKLNKRSIPCYQYNEKYEVVAQYESFNLAAKINKIPKQHVLSSKDKLHKTRGYYYLDKLYSVKEL